MNWDDVSAGDMVRLRSGGPKMVVAKVEKPYVSKGFFDLPPPIFPGIFCNWIDDAGRPHGKSYLPHELEPADTK